MNFMMNQLGNFVQFRMWNTTTMTTHHVYSDVLHIPGNFDVYNIETAMPYIDLEAIENHLIAATKEERRVSLLYQVIFNVLQSTRLNIFSPISFLASQVGIS